MRRLCALALIAALGAASFVFSALAAPTQIQWYDPVQNRNITVGPTSTTALPTVDMSRDRDFPTQATIFDAVTLTAGQTWSQTTATDMYQYSRGVLMLSWAAAAADTDSVRIAVRVYGTNSPTSGNWYAWTPGGLAASDSCVGAATYAASDTTATSVSRCLASNIAFWVQKGNLGVGPQPRISYLASNIMQGNATQPAAGQIVVRKIPLPIMRFASANGVMLNLSDNYGNPCPFPYIRIEVTNAGRSTLSTMRCDVWRRVN